ncbi:MAG TPA: putative glycoside hydrolase [Burkholderiaceae bacterium]|jgi:hypothetical protein|nr:putative glycoside hydrolase [Burkholderiaceae bacterium]
MNLLRSYFTLFVQCLEGLRAAARLTIPLLLAGALLAWHGAVLADPGYPRLFGMNIGEKHYSDPEYQMQLARLDVVILGFYRGWDESRSHQSMGEIVRTLKRLNPHLLVGQYTILNEANDNRNNTAENDKQSKLHEAGWWLTKADGSRVQWTSEYSAWDINITKWAPPDLNGERYPQWLARRDYHVFFEPVPEFDIWYFDNVMKRQRIAFADWKRARRDQPGTDPQIQAAFRQGQRAHWKAAHALSPERILMGNADNDLSFPEYKGRLQGAFLEGLMGKSWSPYVKKGWNGMMEHYHAVHRNLAAPRIIGFNVAGRPDDYRFLRFALTSCLMGDGYFSFTDAARGYSSVVWFDEYDVQLGVPLDSVQEKPWRDGVYRRRFENGMVLVNPDPWPKQIRIDDGYAHFKGMQAPQVNTGLPVRTVLLGPKDGVLLVKGR